MSKLIARARKKAGISQAELARRIGMHRSVVCRIEQGQRGSLRAYQLIGRALGLDYRDLLPSDKK